MAPRQGFRTDLEGLRGIAILLVVLFHAGVPALAGGFVGVDVFFVLSGYFITQGLLREQLQHGTVDLTAFYGRRAMRLVPSLLLVLVATLLLVMWLYAPIDRAEIAGNARAVALGSGNIAFASGSVNYFNSGGNPLLHTWSLAVEEQFYFVWPLVLIGLSFIARRRDPESGRGVATRTLVMGMAIVGVASFIASLWLTHTSQPWAFFGMPTRLWEFALGALCAAWMIHLPPRARTITIGLHVAGICAVVLAVCQYDNTTPYPGIAALLPALGAACMILAAGSGEGDTSSSALTVRLLSASPLQWLGRLSYGWYLWHWPLMGVGAVLMPEISPSGKLAWAVLALGLAWMTYRFIEGSARDGRLARLDDGWRTPAAFIATACVALLAHGAMVRAERQASSPEQRAFAAARTDRMKHDCWGTTIDEWTGPCEFGDTHAATTVVLLGDSHAEHWLGALDRLGRERHWKVVALVKGGCPVAEMPEVANTAAYRECARFREAMVQRIVAVHPAAVILSSWDHYIPGRGALTRWQVAPETWERGLRRTYQRMAGAGLPTLAMRGTPRTWFDVPACLSRRAAHLPFAAACEYDRATASSPVARNAQTRAASGLRVAFVDMNDEICPAARCGVVRHGAIVFGDDNHLTASFSRAVAPVLSTRIDRALAGIGASLP